MQHLDEGTIHSWLDGALSADEAAQVEAHVAVCPQCAAAVAEARGFIAASSRILTALDHVPRGVVPAVPAVKWHNRAAWRAAAAVLVVAVGSLVVVRNGDHKAAVAPAAFDTVGTTKAAVTQPQIMAPSAATTMTRKVQPGTQIKPSTRSATSSGATLSGKPTTEADFSGKSTRAAEQPNVVAREGARNEGVDAAAPSRAEEVAALDVAKEQLPLKVVGTPRMPGAKVTLYEVAPGDTVTFTEALNTRLEAVVVTGISTPDPQALRSVEKSAAAAPTRPPTPSPAAPRLQVEVVNGVTTISWPDLTTGNMLKLSGHIPVERLKEIKLRIERERTAAAAKKGP
jgi:hypothetical protein